MSAEKLIGIVAEFNPFHFGHLHLIQTAKREMGPDVPIVCVLSGDYVQRGDPALFSKFSRAKAACQCGCDLVIELPLPWCASNAESFALGGISLLAGIGITDLFFGCESELSQLQEISELCIEDTFVNRLKDYMKLFPELSYPSAIAKILAGDMPRIDSVLNSPNNILAIEYLKAVKFLNATISPHGVLRIGSGHNRDNETGPLNASSIRRLCIDGKDYSEHIPKQAYSVYEEEFHAGRGPVSIEKLETAMIARLKTIPEEQYLSSPYIPTGIDSRLYRSVQKFRYLYDICDDTKTKRFTHASIRRALLSLALSFPEDIPELPPYTRIFVSNQVGLKVLKKIKNNASVKLISKPAKIICYGETARDLFLFNSRSHDIYTLSYSCNIPSGEDYRKSPIIV